MTDFKNLTEKIKDKFMVSYLLVAAPASIFLGLVFLSWNISSNWFIRFSALFWLAFPFGAAYMKYLDWLHKKIAN